MRKVIVFICSLIFFTAVHAQEVQWAAQVLRYSSQYGKKQYSATQVLGKPNVLPNYGESPVAWAPASEDKGREFVWVEFDKAIPVKQIAIGESLNPGAVSKIILYDESGKRHTVYENKHPANTMDRSRIFHVTLDAMTDYRVKKLWLELNTSAVEGMQQIDCIGISSDAKPIEASINVMQYEKYEGAPENLGPMVNSRYEDRYPIIAPDGKTLYFARKHSPENIGAETAGNLIEVGDDIYYSELGEDGQWSKALNIGPPLNNENNNFVTAVMPDNETLVLANEYTRLAGPGVSISHRKANGEWEKPYPLRIRSMWNDNLFTCYQMNVDGDVIVMAIEQDDSYGDLDIYVSFKEEGKKWTRPLNIGPIVNTAGTEGSAFLAADNRTLYFSSNGHAGYGSYDMFVSQRLDDSWTRWSEPVNLGPVINSPKAEWNYTLSARGDYAYFSSSKSGYGEGDIFRIALPREVQPEPVALIKGQVINSITREPMKVKIKIKEKPNALIGQNPENENKNEKVKELEGKFGLVIPREKEFEIVADEPGYFPEYSNPSPSQPESSEYLDYDEKDNSEKLKREILGEIFKEIDQWVADEKKPQNPQERKKLREKLERKSMALLDRKLSDNSLNRKEKETLRPDLEKEIYSKLDDELQGGTYVELEEDIRMVPLKEGQIIRINNIYFKANQAILLPESFAELDRVLEFLKKNPNIYVEIGGHTNGLPSHEFCDALSQARAKRVYEYLVDNGIPENRLSYKGYGKRMPIADNSTLSGRKKNQRVEMKIIRVE